MADFQMALRDTFKREGGVDDDPADPGHLTDEGITQATYDVWRARWKLPLRPVTEIEPKEVEEIYYSGYFLPCHADLLSDQTVATKIFGLTVMSGLRAAAKILQLAAGDCGNPTLVDAVVGENTIRSANACDPGSLLSAIKDRGSEFFRDVVAHNPQEQKFLRGWVRWLDS